MSKKRNHKKSIICLTPKPGQSFFVYRIEKQRKIFFFFFFLQKTSFFMRKSGVQGLNKKRKEGFLTALATAIKRGPIISIKKHVNEMKVHEKPKP